jgi:hypothetical protein
MIPNECKKKQFSNQSEANPLAIVSDPHWLYKDPDLDF